MKPSFSIALVGDYNPEVPAHVAIPIALGMAAAYHDVDVCMSWLATDQIDPGKDLESFDGIWCAPASPYRNTDSAIEAIRFAREQQRPFLGTCGGFQHALLEFAKNVLRMRDPAHGESNPAALDPLISPLSCSLINEEMELDIAPNSILSRAYGVERVWEQYRCSYGPNPAYGKVLFGSQLRVTARDLEGNVRAAELTTHPFFVGTLFQPERRALKGHLPPLVREFIGSIAGLG